MVVPQQPAVVMEEVTDPTELAEAQARRERFERNCAWFDGHATEIYRSHRGKCICIAGQELFVAETPAEVLALAQAAHPEDDGRFTRIIPKERLARIYAHQFAVNSRRSPKSRPST
jgi:prepilin-type processing-associated H-X9-DG protein